MKKIIKCLIIVIIVFIFFYNKSLVIDGIINGISIWCYSLFPSIFPVMVLSDYIISSNIPYYLSYLFGFIFNKLFGISSYGAYVFFMSMLSGTPSNAKYIKDLLDNNLISNEDASKLLSMGLLYNPFLIITLLGNSGLFFIIVNIISNIIIGIINRNYHSNIYSFKRYVKDFNLLSSINNSMYSLIGILGVICFFLGLSSMFMINNPLLVGLLELTSGLSLVRDNLNYNYLCIMFGFGGFSILFQIKSILRDAQIDYSLYYRSRIIHILLLLFLKTVFCCC